MFSASFGLASCSGRRSGGYFHRPCGPKVASCRRHRMTGQIVLLGDSRQKFRVNTSLPFFTFQNTLHSKPPLLLTNKNNSRRFHNHDFYLRDTWDVLTRKIRLENKVDFLMTN